MVTMSQYKDQKALKSVLKKYLDQSASPAERAAVNSWYEGLGKENQDVPDLDQPDASHKLGRSIKMHLNRQILLSGKASPWLRYLKYAAVFLVLLGTGLFTYQKYHLPIKPEQEVTFKSTQHAAKEISLPDGSVVLLNVGSALTLASDFGTHERRVRLTGEAFFKIAKDKKKPFIIKSNVLTTTVLGTSFNINAYPDLDRIKIAVATGKVRVVRTTAAGEEVLATGMTKDASLTFDKPTGAVTLKTEDASLLSSWKDNKLYLDNLTLSEIAKQLERYYHLKVVFNPALDKGKRYTVRFNQEPANWVMEILSLLTKTKFTYQTNQITIK